MRKYLLFFLFFHLGLYLLFRISEQWLHEESLEMLLFYAAQALLILIYSGYSLQKERHFAPFLMEVTLFRLSTSLIYVAIFLWRGVPSPVFFVIQFACIYLIYLVCELVLFFSIFATTTPPKGGARTKDSDPEAQEIKTEAQKRNSPSQ